MKHSTAMRAPWEETVKAVLDVCVVGREGSEGGRVRSRRDVRRRAKMLPRIASPPRPPPHRPPAPRSQSKRRRVSAERQPASTTPGLMSPRWMRRRSEANSRKKMMNGKTSREMSRASHLPEGVQPRAGRAGVGERECVRASVSAPGGGRNLCAAPAASAAAAAALTYPMQTGERIPTRLRLSGWTAAERAGGRGECGGR